VVTDAAYTRVRAFVGLFHTVFTQVFLAPSLYTIHLDVFRYRLCQQHRLRRPTPTQLPPR
jgi:hypothetical protein